MADCMLFVIQSRAKVVPKSYQRYVFLMYCLWL